MMIRALALASAAATLALTAASAAAAAPARKPAAAPVVAPRIVWSSVVEMTPEGGYRMGNPMARVKLVEYGSLTCGHCAHFAETGMARLVADHVSTGKVSFEYRNYILNGLDVAASLLVRCAPPYNFFRFADRLYATQPAWMGKLSSMPQSEKDRLKALPEGERLGALADMVGLTAEAGQFGVSAARAKACLADEAALDRLGRIAEEAEAQGVEGTPTFFLNGANIGTHSWETLEPILREAAG